METYIPVKDIAVTAITVNGPTNGRLLRRRKLKATWHTIKVGGDVRRILVFPASSPDVIDDLRAVVGSRQRDSDPEAVDSY